MINKGNRQKTVYINFRLVAGLVRQMIIYSIMRSDRDIFCRDDVLDRFNMEFMDEDGILANIYEEKVIEENAYL